MSFNFEREKFAKLLKNARLASNTTIEGAAQKIGISRDSLMRIESGKVACTVDHYIALSNIYDLDVSEVMTKYIHG